jgi:carbon monoxide dehydrogenase subunit G
MVAGFDLAPSAGGVPAATVPAQGAVGEGIVPMVAAADPGPTANAVADATVFGTKVNWQGEAQVFGRLTSVAGGLLQPLAKKQIQKLIDGLQMALT